MKRHDSPKPILVIGFFVIGLLLIVGCIYFFLSYRLTSKARENIEKVIHDTKMVAQVEYGSISADIFTNEITIHDISIKPFHRLGNPITIASISYKTKQDQDSGLYTAISIKLDSLRTILPTKKLNPMAAVVLRQMGLLNINSTIEIDYRYKPITKTMLIKLHQQFKGLADIAFGLIMGNFNPNDKNPRSAMQATIEHVRFQYIDRGLAVTLLDLLAKQAGMTREQFLAKMAARVQRRVDKRNKPHEKAILAKLLLFLKDPKKITFDVKPDPAVSIMELQLLRNPNKLINRLNLNVIVNK